MGAKKILIVDDTHTHLQHITSVVSGAGYQVITADSGRKAVEMAMNDSPDLILMDIVMDDLDGYGACREILERPETKDMPIIFVSTKSTRADSMWAQRQGAKSLISKPFEDEQLLNEIRKY